MTAVDTTPVATNVAGLIADAMTGLYNLASFVQARPDIANRVADRLASAMRHGNHHPARVHLFVGDHAGDGEDVPEHMASLAAEAAEHGARLEQSFDDRYAGVSAWFGLVELFIYAPLSQAGTATTRVESKTVTDWQPHAAIAGLTMGAAR